MKKILFAFMILVTTAHGQTLDVKLSGGFASRYLLRGKLYTESPIMQPIVTVTKGAFIGMVEGVYTFAKDEYQETNFYLGLSNSYGSLMIADYFGHRNINRDLNYFDWSANTTPHIIEMFLNLNDCLKTGLDLKSTVMIFGADKDEADKNQYTTYCELSKPFKADIYTYRPFVGYTPFKGGYADDFAFTNIGVDLGREVQVNDKIKVNVFCTLCVNPYKEDILFVCGVNL